MKKKHKKRGINQTVISEMTDNTQYILLASGDKANEKTIIQKVDYRIFVKYNWWRLSR